MKWSVSTSERNLSAISVSGNESIAFSVKLLSIGIANSYVNVNCVLCLKDDDGEDEAAVMSSSSSSMSWI